MRGEKFALLSGTAVLGVVLLSVAVVSPAGAQNAIDIQKVCGNIVGGDPVNIDPSVPFSAGQQFGCAIKVTDTGTSPLRIDLVQDRVQHVPPVGHAELGRRQRGIVGARLAPQPGELAGAGAANLHRAARCAATTAGAAPARSMRYRLHAKCLSCIRSQRPRLGGRYLFSMQ